MKSMHFASICTGNRRRASAPNRWIVYGQIACVQDGFLVRDLNGNGVIDSGRELFGVDTLKSNGQLATQGFDALADLDSNADGQITSADAAWGQLQVWRDLNQDGISQSNELSTLAGLNITRIGVNGSSTGPQAGQTINNNLVALSTTYTRGGVTRTVGAIDLEANAFFSEIPPEVVDEAGSPVTITAADELEVAVNIFAAGTRRDAQQTVVPLPLYQILIKRSLAALLTVRGDCLTEVERALAWFNMSKPINRHKLMGVPISRRG